MKIGIDIHGVIKTKPGFFAELSQLLVANGHEVHIITGGRKETVLPFLESINMKWTHFYSIIDHKEHCTDIAVRYEGENFWMDSEIWNRAKSEYCKQHNIDLHIDDSDVYGKYFKTPYAMFLKGK